jgi:hypothetical protein
MPIIFIILEVKRGRIYIIEIITNNIEKIDYVIVEHYNLKEL